MTGKRFLNLGSPVQPPSSAPAATVEVKPEKVAPERDNARIMVALSRGICPDCGLRGMQTAQITGRITFHRCLSCAAGFDMDWSNPCRGDLGGGVIITRLELCPACEGLGLVGVVGPGHAIMTTMPCGHCQKRGFIVKR